MPLAQGGWDSMILYQINQYSDFVRTATATAAGSEYECDDEMSVRF
jgi:hypothetical protein